MRDDLERKAEEMKSILDTLPGSDPDTRLANGLMVLGAAAGISKRRSIVAILRALEQMIGTPSYLGQRLEAGRWLYHFPDGTLREVKLPAPQEHETATATVH